MSASAEIRSPLSILHVVEAFGGGMFEILRALSERQADAGNRVAIAYGIRPETPSILREHLDPRVELIPTPWTQRTLGAQVRALGVLRRTARRWRPDLIHLHSSFAGFIGALALGKRYPTVYTPQGYSFTIRGSTPFQFAYTMAERFTARRVSLVGACSEDEAELARTRVRAPHVAVVPNGVSELDPGVEIAPAARADPPLVLASGRIEPQRRPDECAAILSRITDVAEVAWIGDGTAKGELVRAGIEISGWMPQRGWLQRLATATAYLHWSAWDGLPLSIMEALARDVVVVASDIGPNREILGPEQICATPEDAVTLLRRAVLDGNFREVALGRQRQRRERFSAARMSDGWDELYRRLLSPPG